MIRACRRASNGAGRRVFYDERAGDTSRLSEVIVGDGESFEAALRRFNKKIQQAGILAEARRREFYERPAARRKRKEAKRRKR
jgi:small subunit ribosomal protein S21